MTAHGEWVTTCAAAEILGISREAVPCVAIRAGIVCRIIPGVPPAYSKSDPEAIAARAVHRSSIPA